VCCSVSIVPSTCDNIDEHQMLATLERYPSAIPDAVAMHFMRAAGFDQVFKDVYVNVIVVRLTRVLFV
jgi:hypothetical protein